MYINICIKIIYIYIYIKLIIIIYIYIFSDISSHCNDHYIYGFNIYHWDHWLPIPYLGDSDLPQGLVGDIAMITKRTYHGEHHPALYIYGIIYIDLHIYIYIHILYRIYIYLIICIYICIYTCMYVYVTYLCMYVCVCINCQ